MERMKEPKNIFDWIAPELARLEDTLCETLASPVPLIAEMGTHLVRSGGKRLRPALYLLAAKSCKGFDEKRAMPRSFGASSSSPAAFCLADATAPALS